MFLFIHISLKYFYVTVISTAVPKHVYWAKLCQDDILQTVAFQRVHFLTKLQLW